MSAISTIRPYTKTDIMRLQAAAVRFCKRHGIPFDCVDTAETEIEYAIQDTNDLYLQKLWTACYCRALSVPLCNRTTIAYGYIGNRIN